MVKCPNCGEESTANFCPNCGEKLVKEITCPSCNAKVDAGSLFCSECGEKIEVEDKKEEKTTEKTEDKKEEKSAKKTEDKTTKKETTKKAKDNTQYCPHCNDPLDDDEVIFCSNCGKMIKVDEYSFNGIINSINFKKLIIVSILGFAITFVLGIILSFIIGLTGQGSLGYPIALIIAIFLGVGFFASFFKDILNSGLCGIIIGLLFGLVANMTVEISAGFKYTFEIFSGYEIVIFTILGLIFAFLANKFLRNIVLNYINVDKYF
ncbi:zinc ribbon domain-containing protein [Methanobrevibacter sp.]|uniref:zinc ribbon domain-containing protein n=1 Tax=Methanobrevibacter sp. TaxID=66852 RepID=UPI0038909102